MIKDKKGDKGRKGQRGRQLTWWDSFAYRFEDSSTGNPGTGKFRFTGSDYVIDGTTLPFSTFNLETLVTNEVISKVTSGDTTIYTLLKNIVLDTGSTDVDITKTYYLNLKPGYHFDGNGLTITLNNTSKKIGGYNRPTDASGNSLIGQSAPFKIDPSGEFLITNNPPEEAATSPGIHIRNVQIAGSAPCSDSKQGYVNAIERLS